MVVGPVAVRMNEITGVVQRSNSSTALGMGSAVGPQRRPLVGPLGQRHQPAGDQVPGRLVPRHQQLDQEHRQLRLAQLLTVAAATTTAAAILWI